MQDHMFLWWPGKSYYSLGGKFWFIHWNRQTLHLQLSTYFGLYKILLMEEISIPWKIVKGTWKSCLLKKIKSLGKMEFFNCLENGRRQWNTTENACMHAKSLQSCPTLWDPVDYSPPVSSIRGILQARILEWVAIPSFRDLPDPGIKLVSPVAPALQADSLLLSYQGSPSNEYIVL